MSGSSPGMTEEGHRFRSAPGEAKLPHPIPSPAVRHLALAPRARVLELPRPEAALRLARLALGGRVAAMAVARVIARVARAHHGVAEIAALDRTGGHLAL